MNNASSAATVRMACQAMRTRFEIVLCGETGEENDLRAAGEEALEEIVQVESWLSVYRDDAPLFQINAAAGRHAVRVDARVLSFLKTARELSEATSGAFDPTVGPLVTLWRSAGERGMLPTDEEISACQQIVGMPSVIQLDEAALTAFLTALGARLDAGAIGKGYALERAADLLREAGIRSALLHGGTSSVVAIGAPPDNPDGWQLAIQHPTQPDAHLTTVCLRDQALGVSAVHGRTFYAEGRTFGHVLDPRTGYPVEKTILAACIHPSATVADALSTALLVDGQAGLSTWQDRFPDADFHLAE